MDIKQNGIVFEAASTIKNKRFRLNLKLARDVIPEESEWSMASVGRATVELKKRWPQTAWVKLLGKGVKVPQNMHTWWAMKEQHNSAVSKLDFSVTDDKAKKKANSTQANATEAKPASPASKEAPAPAPRTDEATPASSSSTEVKEQQPDLKTFGCGRSWTKNIVRSEKPYLMRQIRRLKKLMIGLGGRK